VTPHLYKLDTSWKVQCLADIFPWHKPSDNCWIAKW